MKKNVGKSYQNMGLHKKQYR